jgi:rhodanese-related sulfurtransferase
VNPSYKTRSAIRQLALSLIVAACLALPAFGQPSPTGNYASEAQDFGVPPQDILHMGQPHAPTPMSVPGAKTITTADLYGRLTARQPMVLLYVNEAQDGLAIVGAHGLDGAGRGQSLDDVVQARLTQKVDQLWVHNKDPPHTFCFDSHCWLSYNTALRLVKAGYRNVFWYRGGREAWTAEGFPLTTLSREGW